MKLFIQHLQERKQIYTLSTLVIKNMMTSLGVRYPIKIIFRKKLLKKLKNLLPHMINQVMKQKN